MTAWQLIAVSAASMLALYAACVLALIAVGRRTEAAALARFVPDCAVLFRRLIADDRVPGSRKLMLGVLAVYLASPLDLVPDFIPVAGALDDAIVVAVALRVLLTGASPALLREHWPGPPSSLNVVLRLGRTRAA
jgi:uncharacterized membrane protein YkvA (DUF1232 family)